MLETICSSFRRSDSFVNQLRDLQGRITKISQRPRHLEHWFHWFHGSVHTLTSAICETLSTGVDAGGALQLLFCMWLPASHHYEIGGSSPLGYGVRVDTSIQAQDEWSRGGPTALPVAASLPVTGSMSPNPAQLAYQNSPPRLPGSDAPPADRRNPAQPGARATF
jgi:hypothetical protein